MSNFLPDDNQHVNVRNFLLDPLSTIVKLAILGHKPAKTKICIYNNILHFQEPGPFQAFCRILYNSNKTDLHYVYNPIYLACEYFLSKSSPFNEKTGTTGITKTRMKHLFSQAQRGLEQLMDTYRTNSTIRHSLNYYHFIIANYIDDKYDADLFRSDGMTVLYSDAVVASLNQQWNDSWLNIVLDMVGFLSSDNVPTENIRALESLMVSIDANTRQLLI